MKFTSFPSNVPSTGITNANNKQKTKFLFISTRINIISHKFNDLSVLLFQKTDI